MGQGVQNRKCQARDSVYSLTFAEDITLVIYGVNVDVGGAGIFNAQRRAEDGELARRAAHRWKERVEDYPAKWFWLICAPTGGSGRR